MRWTPRYTKLAGGSLVALALGGCYWFAATIRSSDLCIGHGMTVRTLLAAYAQDHGGRLPGSLNELVQTGYLELDNSGDLRLAGKSRMAGWGPEFTYFDIAWGTWADQVDARGFVPDRARMLLVPSESSWKAWCDDFSASLAEAMHSAAATRPSAGQP